jgi:hypothetical protein
VRRQLELAVEHDPLVGMKDVGEKRLIEPDGAQHPGAIAHQHLENREARPPRRTLAAADDVGQHRHCHARLQRRDRPERAAILVAHREAIQEIFDRRQTDALEVRGASRADPFQILER